MSILDAYGRPIQKAEVESLSRRGIMLPAHALFGSVGQEDASRDFSPFVITSDSPAGVEKDEFASNWMPGGQPSSPYGNLNPRFAHKNPISQLNIPRDTVGLMTISLTYGQENYMVNRGVRIKRNFALRDLQFLGSETTRNFYHKEFIRLRVRKILSYAFRYYWTTGRVCVYWGDERPIQRLAILDPRSILVKRILGQNVVYLLPDQRWKVILSSDEDSKFTSPEAAFLKKHLPRYWIKYIKNNEPIPLKEDSYALIENDLELFSLRGIDAPSNLPLQPIFQNLATMDMLVAGDFSVAWMLKHMIALVSIGDPKAEGTNYNPPDQNDLKKLEATFNRPDYSLWAYVDPTVDIRWIAPDPKLFEDKKYKHHIEAVEWCLGVPSVFTQSGGTFSTSSLSMKPFREEIEYARTDIEEQFFTSFFPTLREGVTARKSGGKDPDISWDVDCLKDDRVIMDELTNRYDRGALSVRSLLEGKAQDFDIEVQRKLEELGLMKEHEGLLAPAFDAAHGVIDGGEGGRPITNGKPTPESDTHTQAARPSRGV